MEVRGQKSEVRWFTAILAAYTIHLVSIWNDYTVSVDDLLPMKFSHDESEQMLDLAATPLVRSKIAICGILNNVSVQRT